MAVWSTSLPQLQLMDGLSYAPSDQAIRTTMDTGPTKARRRFSVSVAEVQVPIILTGTQLAAFDTYYQTTLSGGTDTFTWTDPSTGSTATYRFLDRPAFVPIRPAGAATARLWRGTLRLERQA